MRLFSETSPSIVSISGDDIRREIEKIDRSREYLTRILSEREGDGNVYKYGYMEVGGGYRVFDSLAEAVDTVVKQTKDPDNGYKVIKVYL